MKEEKYFIGVDLGGTTTKIGIVNKTGKLILYEKYSTDVSRNGENILSDISKQINIMVDKLKIDKKDIHGIGIGVPGPVEENGIVRFAVNLGWNKPRNIEENLKKLTGINLVKSANDATLAALGEIFAGTAKNIKNAIMITLGTGVGGGIITNGKVVYGYTGQAGEIGHIIIDENDHSLKEKCKCGKIGCLEQYASANGIVRLAKTKVLDAIDLEKSDLANMIKSSKNITSKDIWDKVKENDQFAIEVANDFSKKMAKAIDMILKINNPEIIILGGGMIEAGDIIIKYIEKNYNRYYSSTFSKPKIVLAKIGNKAGVIGAARLVIDSTNE